MTIYSVEKVIPNELILV